MNNSDNSEDNQEIDLVNDSTELEDNPGSRSEKIW